MNLLANPVIGVSVERHNVMVEFGTTLKHWEFDICTAIPLGLIIFILAIVCDSFQKGQRKYLQWVNYS